MDPYRYGIFFEFAFEGAVCPVSLCAAAVTMPLFCWCWCCAGGVLTSKNRLRSWEAHVRQELGTSRELTLQGHAQTT
jgi:hypothetical protein